MAAFLEKRGREALDDMPEALAHRPRIVVPLKPKQIVGRAALEEFFSSEIDLREETDAKPDVSDWDDFDALVDQIDGENGVVMTMGKGGVGKTTIAAKVALALAERGRQVLLTTTDPAAHVAAAAGGDVPENLEISRIDPEAEVEKYREKVLSTTGATLDADGLALLEEDLASPCTEEIAVFQAFAHTVNEATDRIVVMDTAPTGHTILLLDAAQSFHKEVSRQAQSVPEAVLNLLPRLRDPDFTKILICTLPEATPVHEAAQLQTDLRRANIEPFGWVVNQSFAPLELTDDILLARQAQEGRYLAEVRENHANFSSLITFETAQIAERALEPA